MRYIWIAGVLGMNSGVLAGPIAPPPGPVGESYKTLTEVEPRTALSATNTPGNAQFVYIINQSGSYYLTENLIGVAGKGGIWVLGADVTLDLNGFTLDGTGGSGSGIQGDADSDRLVIRNGHVSNWPLVGIMLEETPDVVVEDVTVSSTGGMGIFASSGVVTECRVINAGSDGIFVSGDSIVENCRVTGCTGAGIVAWTDSIVRGCLSVGNTLAGIETRSGSGNLFESNTALGNGAGLRALTPGNTFRNNHVNGNADNYDFAPGNNLELLLSEIPESIDWAAKVTLEGSLTGLTGQNGIDVTSGDVSIDLGGHSLIGVPGSNRAIETPLGGLAGISVTNGTIRDWGSSGIFALGSPDMRIDGVAALANGGSGFRTGDRAKLTNCRAIGNSGTGIYAGRDAVVENCETLTNGLNGVTVSTGSVVRDSMSHDNGLRGISASAFGRILRCLAENNGTDGILGGTQTTIRDCQTYSNSGAGIAFGPYSHVADNLCRGDADGIVANGAGCRIEGNAVTGCSNTGYTVNFFDNLIIKNSASGNTVNYSINAGNNFGPIVTLTGAGSISGIPDADHPWANFVH